MSITGKKWTAILVRHPTLSNLTAYTTELIFEGGQQTLDDIATYYPSLAWDNSTLVPPDYLESHYLAQFGAVYDDIETAQTDLQNYIEQPDVVTGTGVRDGFIYDDGYIRVLFADGMWQTTNPYAGGSLPGAPSVITGHYPDANTYNIFTATPFGSYGHGLIRHQAIYHYPGGAALGGDNPVAGVYPDSDPGVGHLIDISVVDRTFIWTPTRSTDTGDIIPPTDSDGAGDGITDNDVTLRCWTYSLDGHDYYVLRLGPSETLVYDLTTGSWSEWRSPGRTNWRAHVGCNWVGMSVTTLNRGFGTDVVAGDDSSGVLWVLDPTVGRDDRTTTGSDNITRVVTGGIQMTGRDSVACNAVQLDLALGDPSQAFASITLDTSDDFGHTWDTQGTIQTNAFDYRQVIEWRSLGLISNPGRLFRITDNGATVRIDGADMR